MNEDKIVRNYKDTVFVDLFGKCSDAKENFLSLYNALHGTNLTLAETTVEPLTLDQTIYMGLYNDVAMLVNNQIVVLLEQQSTINENMPLRFLQYISRLYEKVLPYEVRYKRNMVQLPMPEFYVFYNGLADYDATKILKLSDSFTENNEKNENFLLELNVTVYNINKLEEIPFIKNCSSLVGYSKFVEYARKAKKSGIKNHIKDAIDCCIKEGILVDYLLKNSVEVQNMLIGEYDYDMDIKVQRQESFEEGMAKQKEKDEKLFASMVAEKDKEIEKQAKENARQAEENARQAKENAKQAEENKRLLEEIAKLKAEKNKYEKK